MNDPSHRLFWYEEESRRAREQDKNKTHATTRTIIIKIITLQSRSAATSQLTWIMVKRYRQVEKFEEEWNEANDVSKKENTHIHKKDYRRVRKNEEKKIS